MLATIITVKTALWLVASGASIVIGDLAPFATADVRETLRPYFAGVIDAQDQRAKAYSEEHEQAENAARTEIEFIQRRLVSRTQLFDALGDFNQLKKTHWPELPSQLRSWLIDEISGLLIQLELDKSMRLPPGLRQTVKRLFTVR